MRKTLILIWGFVVILSSSVATAQSVSFEPSPYIFRLKISNCGDHEPTNRRQTGFRVQGVIGIVTALHGVADCSLIHALSDGDGTNFKNLQIQAVDIDHDVALLTSPELLELPADGLPVMVDQELQIDQLQLIGYPLGLDEQDIVIDVSINYSRTLKSLIPKSDLPESLRERNSPNLDTKVFRVQTHLVPGHSGSPLLDSAGRVIAVANGGLKQGTVEIGWAMPWQDIIWQDILPAATADKAVLDRFAELKTQNPQFALAFSSTYPPTIEQNEQDITMVGTVVGVSAEAIRDAEVTLTLIDAYYVALTDDNGKFQFSLDPDNVEKFREILVERDGYQDRRLNVFDQLPQSIQLEVVRAPAPVNLEISDYVRVIWSTGINLHQSPRSDSPIKDELSEGRLLQILEGPEQQKEQKWWQVRLLGSSNQTGWVVASSDSDIYLERLPFFVHDDKVKVTAESRLRLRQTPGTNTRIIGALETGDEAIVNQGPEEANGYLWYELLNGDGKSIGWVAAISNEGVFLEQIETSIVQKDAPTPRIALATSTPRPTVDPSTPVQLEIDGVESSSNNGVSYMPAFVLDGKPKTSWVSGFDDIPGGWIKLLFRTPKTVTRIGIYRQPNPHIGQVKEAVLIFSDGSKQPLNFKGFSEWEYVDIDPVTTDSVTLEVINVYPASQYIEVVDLTLYGSDETGVISLQSNDELAFEPLKIDGIEGSSRNGSSYKPDYVLDGKFTTSWVSGFNDIPGGWLKLLFRTPKIITRIGIYRQSNPSIGQVREATLIFSDGSKQLIAFKGFSEWEYVDIDPVTTDFVVLEVAAVYPASQYIEMVDLTLFGSDGIDLMSATPNTHTAFEALKIDGVESSSNNGVSYAPDMAIDDKPATSWVSGFDDIPGGWIKLLFRTPQTVSRIGIYRKPNADIGQVQEGVLIFSDGSQQSIRLKGFSEWEYIDINPVTTDSVIVEVSIVYPPHNYIEIVDLTLWGPSKTGLSPTTELNQTNQIHITVTGVGFAPATETNPARRKQYALTGAKADASKNFAAWQVGEDLESVTVVEKNELQIEKVTLEIRAKVKGGTIIDQTYDDTTGTAEVTVEYTVDMTQ